MGRVKKGESFTVVTRTTGDCDQTDIREVLYINGYKEKGGGTAYSYGAAGNWICRKISDDTYPAWWEQHKRYEDEVERDKIIEKYQAESSYKSSSNNGDLREKSSKARKSEKTKTNDGCLMKIVKAPFRFLWWLIKKAFVILSLGLLSGVLNSDKK